MKKQGGCVNVNKGRRVHNPENRADKVNHGWPLEQADDARWPERQSPSPRRDLIFGPWPNSVAMPSSPPPLMDARRTVARSGTMCEGGNYFNRVFPRTSREFHLAAYDSSGDLGEKLHETRTTKN